MESTSQGCADTIRITQEDLVCNVWAFKEKLSRWSSDRLLASVLKMHRSNKISSYPQGLS